MPNDTTQQAVLNIEVNVAEAVKRMEQYRTAIDGTKKQIKDLRQELKDGQISEEDYNEAVARATVEQEENRAALRETQKEVKNAVEANRQQEGSLNSLRAELRNLTAQYDAMSKTERESAAGQGMLQHIQELQPQIKSLEEETGRFQRSVGGYEQAIASAIGASTPFSGILSSIATGSATASSGFTVLKTTATSLGQALKTLAVNPIFLILSTVALLITGIVKAMKSSEEATNRLNVVLAPFQRMLQAVLGVLQTVAGWLLSVAEGAAKVYDAIFSWLGDYIPAVKEMNEATRAAIELEKEKQDITRTERENQVQNAKDELEIAQLRKEARDTENLTAQERLDMLTRANRLEEERMQREVDIARRRLEVLKTEASYNQTSTEQLDEIARAEAEVYNKEKEYYTLTTRLQSQMISTQKEMAEAEQKTLEERRSRLEAEQKDMQAAQDALLRLMDEGYEKQRKTTEQDYARRIDALQKRLDEETDLTEKQRSALMVQITALSLQEEKALAEIDAEELRLEADRQTRILQLRLETAQKGSEEEHALRLEQLRRQMESEVSAAGESAEEVALIREKYRQLAQEEEEEYQASLLEARQEEGRRIVEETRLEWENRIEEARQKGEDYLAIVAEQKAAELQAIIDAGQLEGETQAEYNARLLKAQRDYNASMQAIADAEVKIQSQKAAAISSITGSLASVMDAFSDDSITNLKISKALGIAQCMIEQGIAIANVVAANSNQPWFIALPTIIAAIATVTTTIVSAISSINQAEASIAEAQSESGGSSSATTSVRGFASGGYVRGAGTGTSDSIPARLSAGEYVVPADVASMFPGLLSDISAIGQGWVSPVSIGTGTSTAARTDSEDALTEAFSEAVADLDIRPVVSVQDINRGQSRVSVIETRSRRTNSKS